MPDDFNKSLGVPVHRFDHTIVVLPKTSLGDIDDVEAFVIHCMKRTKLKIPQEKWEDMKCAALVELIKLHSKYDRSRDQGADAVKGSAATAGVASFAGYANYLLPNRIITAWHEMHPEHKLLLQEDGSRKWVYHEPTVSLDEIVTRRRGSERFPEGSTPLDDRSTRHPGNFIPVPSKAEG